MKVAQAHLGSPTLPYHLAGIHEDDLLGGGCDFCEDESQPEDDQEARHPARGPPAIDFDPQGASISSLPAQAEPVDVWEPTAPVPATQVCEAVAGSFPPPVDLSFPGDLHSQKTVVDQDPPRGFTRSLQASDPAVKKVDAGKGFHLRHHVPGLLHGHRQADVLPHPDLAIGVKRDHGSKPQTGVTLPARCASIPSRMCW